MKKNLNINKKLNKLKKLSQKQKKTELILKKQKLIDEYEDFEFQSLNDLKIRSNLEYLYKQLELVDKN